MAKPKPREVGEKVEISGNGKGHGQSVVEALLSGARPQGFQSKAPETLSDRMYQGDGHLPMKTRLDARMVGAVARAQTMSGLIGFPGLKTYADLLMQLHVSLDGKGRAEAVDMARVTAITQIGGVGNPDVLEG